MTPKRLSVTPATVIALFALFFALGGSAFAVGDSLTQRKEGRKEGRTDTFVGQSSRSFQDALHRSSQLAADFQRGRYRGQQFEVTRTTIVFSNPHITAYRVTITPTG